MFDIVIPFFYLMLAVAALVVLRPPQVFTNDLVTCDVVASWWCSERNTPKLWKRSIARVDKFLRLRPSIDTNHVRSLAASWQTPWSCCRELSLLLVYTLDFIPSWVDTGPPEVVSKRLHLHLFCFIAVNIPG